MASISKSVYINKLANGVNKCNNTYNGTIEMKYLDVKSNTYINFGKEIDNKDPKFKIGGAYKMYIMLRY